MTQSKLHIILINDKQKQKKNQSGYEFSIVPQSAITMEIW